MTTKKVKQKPGPIPITINPTPTPVNDINRILNVISQSGELNHEDIEIKEVLGRGQYGVVKKAIHKTTNVAMAVKEIPFSQSEETIKQIKNELEVLRDSKSNEIVTFYGSFLKETTVYYCMEYMDYGSLDKLYRGGVPENVLAKIAISVIRGLKYLKEVLNIIHRDVKPTNILANAKGEVKLCDFGISGHLVQSVAKTYIGCSNYMAPERIDTVNASQTYDVRSDVWSLGISLLEIGNGDFPYPVAESIFAQLQNIVDGATPKLKSVFSVQAQEFINKCLDKNYANRPTYAQLLEHPWLKKYENDDVDMIAWFRDSAQRAEEFKKLEPKKK